MIMFIYGVGRVDGNTGVPKHTPVTSTPAWPHDSDVFQYVLLYLICYVNYVALCT